MPIDRPSNISAFNEDQQRAIEDLYNQVGKLTDEDLVETTVTRVLSGGGGGTSDFLTRQQADDIYFNEFDLFSEIAATDQNTALQNLGVTATKAQLNYLDGTLSEIQTNIGLKNGNADLDINSLVIQDGLTSNGNALFDIGNNEFRIRNGTAMFVLDGSTGQIALGAEPNNDIGLLLDTPARAVSDNTDYDRLRVSNSGNLTVAANTTSTHIATAQFNEPNINLASGASVTSAYNVYIPGAPTEGDSNWALYVGAGMTGVQDLEVQGTINYVNEENLQVEDHTITVNVTGTNTSAEDSGLIVERPGGNKNFLWDSTLGFNVDDHLSSNPHSLVTDFNGTGWQMTHAGSLNIERLIVRKYAKFRELIIDQLSAVGGSTILSGARGKIASVSGSDVTLEDPNDTGVTQFTIDSLFVVRDVDVDGSEIKFVAGIVTNKNGMTLTLSNADADLPAIDQGKAWGSIGNLEEGDVIVERGHTSTASRQNVIYETATDSDAPVTKYLDGIDSLTAFSQVASIQSQLGVLDNLTSTYSNVSGKGLFSSRTYLTDVFQVGNLDATGEDFLKFASGNLDAVLNSLDVTIDSSNKIVADSNGMSLSATTFTLDATDAAGGIYVDSGTPKFSMFSGGTTSDDEVLQINANASVPTTVQTISEKTPADESATGATQDGFYHGGAVSIADDEFAIVIGYDVSVSNISYSAGSAPVNLKVEVSPDSGTSWVTWDLWDLEYIDEGGSYSRSVSDKVYNIFGYTHIRAGFEIVADSFDYSITNRFFGQYKGKIVFNDKGIFHRISPDIVKTLSGSGDTFIDKSAVSSIFGRTGDVTAQQSDYDSFFVPKSGGEFTGDITMDGHIFHLGLVGGYIRFDSDGNGRNWADWEENNVRFWRGTLETNGNLKFTDNQGGNAFQIDGIVEFNDVTRWTSPNGALQRADARDDNNAATVYWYGKSDTGSLVRARHNFYDGSSYVNFRPTNGNININGGAIYHEGHKPTASEVDAVSATSGGTFSGKVTFNDDLDFDANGSLFSFLTDGTGRGLWDARASGTQVWQVRLDSNNNLFFDKRDASAGEFQVDGSLRVLSATEPAITLKDTDNVHSEFKIYSPDGSNNLVFLQPSTGNNLLELSGGWVRVLDGSFSLDATSGLMSYQSDSNDRNIAEWTQGGTRIWSQVLMGDGTLRFLNDAGGDTFQIDATLNVPTIETDVLRTTLFHYDQIQAVGGKSVITNAGTVEAVDTGTNQVTLDNASIPENDHNTNRTHVVVSGFNSNGFANIEARVDAKTTDAQGRGVYTLIIDTTGASISDIESGMSMVQADDDMILLDASGGANSIPTIAGYNDIAGHLGDSPILSDNSNASPNWEINQNGIYYDAMGSTLIHAQNFAPFGQDNGHANNPTNSDWSTQAATSSEGVTITNFLEVANGTFIKEYGEDILIFRGAVKFDLVSKTGVQHTSEVTILVRGTGVEVSQNIPSSSWTYIDFEVDISSISNNSSFTVEIHAEASVTISSGAGDGSTYSTESFIQEGFVLRTGTGNA